MLNEYLSRLQKRLIERRLKTRFFGHNFIPEQLFPKIFAPKLFSENSLHFEKKISKKFPPKADLANPYPYGKIVDGFGFLVKNNRTKILKTFYY